MRVRMGILLLLLIGVVSGCAKSGGTHGVATAGRPTAKATGTAGAGSGSDQDRMLQFARCMRQHGINMPDPQPGHGTDLNIPEGSDKSTVDAAMAACKSLLPNGGEPQKIDPQTLNRLRQFAKCMRANGITKFPDPTDYGIQADGNTSGLDPNSPSFKAAQQKCAQYQPKPPSGEPTGGTTNQEGNG